MDGLKMAESEGRNLQVRRGGIIFICIFIAATVLVASHLPNRSKPTRDNFNRIQSGMSYRDVELLMGNTDPPEPYSAHEDISIVDGYSQHWYSADEEFTNFRVSYSTVGIVEG